MTMLEKYGVMRECAACGKNGKIVGEMVNGRNTYPLCNACLLVSEDDDDRRDIWAAIRVRLNSGAYKLPRDVGKEGSAEG